MSTSDDQIAAIREDLIGRPLSVEERRTMALHPRIAALHRVDPDVLREAGRTAMAQHGYGVLTMNGWISVVDPTEFDPTGVDTHETHDGRPSSSNGRIIVGAVGFLLLTVILVINILDSPDDREGGRDDSAYWVNTGYEYADGIIDVDGETDMTVITGKDCPEYAENLGLTNANRNAFMQGCRERASEFPP